MPIAGTVSTAGDQLLDEGFSGPPPAEVTAPQKINPGPGAGDVNYLGLTISGFVNVDFSMAPMAGNRVQADGKSPAARPKKGKKEKVYNFYGTLKSMDSRSLVVDSKWGTESFVMTDSSIKGAPDYDPGTLLHVYYKQQDIGNVVTMVVRKVE